MMTFLLQAMYEEMEVMNEELIDTSDALMQSNEEIHIFKEIADASIQGFIISDVTGTITYLNEAMKTDNSQHGHQRS